MKNSTVKISSCRKIRRDDGLKMKAISGYTFRHFLENIESRYSERVMYRVYRRNTALTYGRFAQMARSISSYLLDNGYSRGDKVAIMAESCPEWMVSYVALTSIGLVAVPMLPDFAEAEAVNILRDCEAKGIFVNRIQYTKMNRNLKELDIDVFRLEDLSQIGYVSDKEYMAASGRRMSEYHIDCGRLDFHKPQEQDVASIIYTSGTTGSSKGVMLTHMNLLRCADYNTDIYMHVKPGMKILSILPLSHVYEFTLGQLLLLLCGCEITFLGRPPAASVLLPALKEIRPVGMFCVPLLIEKVYRASVVPVLKGNAKIAKLNENRIISAILHRVIGHKIMSAFGGNLRFLGIGGAPLDPEVEQFLYRANFPYAIGYGLTETSPLIAACRMKRRTKKLGFIGAGVGDCVLRIDEPNEEGVGEIVVKGPNVTKGYYNNPELTAESFTEDGFFRTGDLGIIDERNMVAVRGRKKTMILGPSGENIYPEAIENLINAEDYVAESLVVPQDGGLVALIRVDIEKMAEKLRINISDAKLEAENYVSQLRVKINRQVSSFQRLQKAELQDVPFERTPTMKIKRFLYPKDRKAV